MKEHRLELADVFRTHQQAFLARWNSVLSRQPDIYSVRVNKDSFIIVASDGAFDPGHYDFKKSAEAVVKLVEAGADAQTIVDRAVKLPTGDNVSAIIARFANE